MNILESLLSGLTDNTSATPQTQSSPLGPLLQIALQMLASNSSAGGLGGLMEQFQRAGFGPQMNSWVSTGQNLPISPDQLMQIFGRGQMQQMAADSGLGVDQVSDGLAGMLPQLIDQLTPSGQVPATGIDGALAELSRMMPR